MSWNAEAMITVVKDQKPKIEIVSENPQTQHGADESRGAIAAAREAAWALLETGKLGFGRFCISMNGHSNPGNVPCNGWVNDNVQINIQQMSEAQK